MAYRLILSSVAAGVSGLAAFGSISLPSSFFSPDSSQDDGSQNGGVAAARDGSKTAAGGPGWATDPSTVIEVRKWVSSGKFQFVKEVDTCSTDSDKGVPKVENTPNPPTQLQVWRLGTDGTADFPAFTVREFFAKFKFPLGAFAGNASATSGKTASEGAHEQQTLSPSPLLRLVVFIPNASTRRVLSEVTDPSRRKMWDTNYKEFIVLQDYRASRDDSAAAQKKKKKKTAKPDANEQRWIDCAMSQEQQKEANAKEHKIESYDPRVQELLRSQSYQDMQQRRFRCDPFQQQSGEPAFDLEYSRWTFHRIYSTMTAAFGMKPRISYLERVYGERRVENESAKRLMSGNVVIRTAIDTSISLPFSTDENDNNAAAADAADAALSSSSPAITSSEQLHEAAWRVAKAAKIPVSGDVPVFNHIQEILLFPLPAGSTDLQISALMEQTGKDSMGGGEVLKYYESEWLPQIAPNNASISSSNTNFLPQDGVLMSFTTANSTGLVGYPRWFERYVQKLFSTHAMGSLVAQVQQEK